MAKSPDLIPLPLATNWLSDALTVAGLVAFSAAAVVDKFWLRFSTPEAVRRWWAVVEARREER